MKISIAKYVAGILLAISTAAAQQAPEGGVALPPPGAPPPGPAQVGLGPDQGPPRPPAPGANHDPIGENLFPPDLVMAHQKAIGLDDTQKSYIREEILKAQTRFTELQWQLQDAMESLASLLKEDRVDEQQALSQLDKVLTSEREIKRAQIGLMVRIKNKLTPEQQAQLRQLRGPSGPPM